ncbi:MAG: caspase family protein [Chitinophagaceae bacterium]|nr:caspase family protein [Chitinophagaceae bacterium]
MAIRVCRNIIHFSFPLFICLFSFAAFSQTPKGLSLVKQQTFSNGKTRALIIGISNYQYIDKLQYADKDAEVFAEYLGNNSFWNIDKNDITLLTNEKAKRGNVITELQRIFMLSEPGDNLVFYFSGHGDVETLTMFNKGYLLTYDTYSNNYMAGALSVNDLKDLFVTLTTKNVQVIVITDACHAGKLAGGPKGVEFTAVALKTIWNNEIKILSSEPNQASQEGPQWGNGRGVFSYYLVKGLKGEADFNKDSAITLAELQQYFGQTVYLETNTKQQPSVHGPNEFSTVIARLNSSHVKKINKPAGNTASPFRRFRFTDDSCSFYYKQLNTAINSKKFERKDTNSASASYRKLKNCTNDSGFIFRANSILLSGINEYSPGDRQQFIYWKNLVDQDEFDYAIDLYDQVLQNNDLRLPYQQQLTNLKKISESTRDNSLRQRISDRRTGADFGFGINT